MNKLFVAAALAFIVAAAAPAQEKKMEIRRTPGLKADGNIMLWYGYVVDAMCARNMAKKKNVMERAARHTKECALEEACAASGYGLFFEEGKWAKFDEAGDKQAKELIEKSKRQKDLMFEVKGRMEGEKLIVIAMKEASKPPATPDIKKLEEKKLQKKTG